MSDTPTPRTDELAGTLDDAFMTTNKYRYEEMTALARELERELAEAEAGANALFTEKQMLEDLSADQGERILSLERELARLRGEIAHLVSALGNHGSTMQSLLDENARLRRIESLARDAVEAGAVDECYLSLLRDALGCENRQHLI